MCKNYNSNLFKQLANKLLTRSNKYAITCVKELV